MCFSCSECLSPSLTPMCQRCAEGITHDWTADFDDIWEDD